MDLLEHVIIELDKIRTEYLRTPDAFNLPVNLSIVTDIVRNRLEIDIEHRKANWDDNNIKGCLLRYTDKAIIYTSDNLNTCWERFVYCKELCHLVLDDESWFTKDPSQLVEDLISDRIFSDDDGPSPDVLSENMTIIGAIEILFPFSIRGQFRDMQEQKEKTAYEMATILRIPQTYLEVALSRRVREIVDACHRELRMAGKVEN